LHRDDLAELATTYGLVVVDECHHSPAAAFENVVRQIAAQRWLGLTAAPYRRDQLDDMIALQLGPVRHTMSAPAPGTLAAAAAGGFPDRSLTCGCPKLSAYRVICGYSRWERPSVLLSRRRG
jgi:hypothetical protein